MKKEKQQNIYWKDTELPPAECLFIIRCAHLTKNAFRAFKQDMKRERIYYDHNAGHDSGEYRQAEQTVTLAFANKHERDAHANRLQYQAKRSGYDVKMKG